MCVCVCVCYVCLGQNNCHCCHVFPSLSQFLIQVNDTGIECIETGGGVNRVVETIK